MAPEIIHGPARHPCSTGRQEPAAEGQLDYSGFARRGERCLVGVGSVYLTTHSVLVTLIAAVSAGGCLARAVARAFIRDCCLQPTVPRTAVSYAIASARQPTTTQSDRILLQLTEYVSGEYVTLPVSRRGPRGVQAGIAGSRAQGLAACLTLPGEEDCAIAEPGDYLEPRQPGTRQERMGGTGTGR
jgi:hypothetical protein